MTLDDIAYIEKWICDRTVVYYRESEAVVDDVLASASANEYDDGEERPSDIRNRVFVAECKMNAWANERVRVNYFLGAGHENVGYEYTAPSDEDSPADFDRFSVWNPAHELKSRDPVVEAYTYHFSPNPAFSNNYMADFRDTLDGLTVRSLMFSSGNATDYEAYEQWTFPTPAVWDQYWYAAGNTLMFMGVPYVIGSSGYGTITIRALPQVTVMRDEVPLLSSGAFGDMSSARCIYARTNEQNIDGRVQLTNDFSDRALRITIDFDYTQRFFVLEKVDSYDILVAIGGSFAFFFPVAVIASPFMLGYFLYQMALVISEEYEHHHQRALVDLLKILIAKIRYRRKLYSRFGTIRKICNNNFHQMKQWVNLMERAVLDLSRKHEEDTGDRYEFSAEDDDEHLPPLYGLKEANLKPAKLRTVIENTVRMVRVCYDDCIHAL